KLKADDLIRAVDRMLNSRVSLVGYGTLKQMQPYDLIDRAIHLNDLPDACKVPLSVPLSGLPEATYVTVVSEDDPFKAKISKLNSGLRIASEKKYGEFCTIGGTVVDAGSRYEALFPSGTSHFLEKLAFTV
ncbi:conserved hypothetical protein, partial [Trichinella spiralis]|uniref:hypothetical protein n=1 Tax=Trichinella spiralis TaxID=6334 RepID=UPI0001EFDB10